MLRKDMPRNKDGRITVCRFILKSDPTDMNHDEVCGQVTKRTRSLDSGLLEPASYCDKHQLHIDHMEDVESEES